MKPNVPNFIQLHKLSLTEFIDIVKTNSKVTVIKSGEVIYKISNRKRHWIHLIENNQLTCPVTGKKVVYCSFDKREYMNPIEPTYHYNFYSEDGVLFSIDHKLPISQGGSKTSVNNVQPMIILENFKKQSQLIYL